MMIYMMGKSKGALFGTVAVMRTWSVKAAILLLSAGGVSETGVTSDRSDALDLSRSMERRYQAAQERSRPFDVNAGLDDYLAYAALNNPGLKAAFYRWKAALEKTGYVSVLPDPMFSYGYFIENVETRVGPQNQRFSLKQSFPWFGTLDAKGDIAFEAANAAYQKYQWQKLKLFYQVKRAYYDYYYLGREIQITKENMELLGFWESVARAKYKVALRMHHDLIKAQVELGKLEDRLATVEEMAVPIAARLRAALNLPSVVELPIPDTISIEEIHLDRDSTITQAVSNNPDLIAIEHLIDREKAAVRLASKTSYPNFTFGVDYLETDEAVNPMMDESGKDPWAVSVAINLPLWFGKNKAKKNEARARYRQAQHNLANAKNRIIEVTESVLFGYEDALRKLRLYRDGLVPKAEQSLNAEYAAYQAGETDFLNVLDAQRQLLDFQLKLDKAVTDLATRRAEIEMITGHQIDYNQKP